jgi:hypothetical protein
MKPTVEFLERWLDESPDTAVRILPEVINKQLDAIAEQQSKLLYLLFKVQQVAAEKQKETQGKSDEHN